MPFDFGKIGQSTPPMSTEVARETLATAGSDIEKAAEASKAISAYEEVMEARVKQAEEARQREQNAAEGSNLPQEQRQDDGAARLPANATKDTELSSNVSAVIPKDDNADEFAAKWLWENIGERAQHLHDPSLDLFEIKIPAVCGLLLVGYSGVLRQELLTLLWKNSPVRLYSRMLEADWLAVGLEYVPTHGQYYKARFVVVLFQQLFEMMAKWAEDVRLRGIEAGSLYSRFSQYLGEDDEVIKRVVEKDKMLKMEPQRDQGGLGKEKAAFLNMLRP